MTTLHVLTGLPGAGKTRRASEIIGATGAVHIEMDGELAARGISIVDYETRFAVQPEVEAQIGVALAAGRDVVAEFGSWSREERDRLRAYGERAGARTVLHWLDAPIDICRERLLARGGEGAEVLARDVLGAAGDYQRPSPDETAAYDAYLAPGDAYDPAEI